MRNLPLINAVHSDDCKCQHGATCIDLRKWLAGANIEDLHSLYSGDIANNTGFQFHDLFFNLHYRNSEARAFRQEILHSFRELVSGETSIQNIKIKVSGTAQSKIPQLIS